MGATTVTATALIIMTTLHLEARQDEPWEQGISHELARSRKARISKLRYELGFDLGKNRDEVRGTARVHFELEDAKRPLVLDFDGIELGSLSINGTAPGDTRVRRINNHHVIDASLLRSGKNTVSASFRSRVAATGTPLTSYRDKTQGDEYLYSLLVPADAHRLFPCFDQPDLKGSIRLTLTVPKGWTAVANAAGDGNPTVLEDGRVSFKFKESKAISTYLMAFAAGPFRVLRATEPDEDRPMQIYVRPSKAEMLDAQLLLDMHEKSLAWCERYFGMGYPFGKLDIVLVPGFPYGGMEHAGAIFYRESALVFDHEPTEVEKVRRSTLIYHEVSHQWFGNLVTMEWFDDLWLKEGFATFIGYSILDELEPDKNAWLRFHQRVKPPAYRVDVTEGTTPVFQELGNLDDAKSNYGAIVYNKAPSILKALETRIGKEDFRQGVRLFLKQHAWGNASWSQLLEAFEKAADEKLRGWSRWWILTAGMPRVRASWKTGAEGTIIAFRVAQEPIQQKIDGAWPMTVPILAMQENGNTETRLIRLDKKETEVPDLLGTPAPAWVLLNHLDTAYGQFLLDERSRDHLLRSLPAIKDPFLRVVAFTAMFETVREAELSPEKFAELAQKMLEDENDPLTHAQVVAALSTTLDRYLDPEKAKPLRSETASMLRRQLRNGELPGLELQAYRALTRLGRDEETMDLFEKVLDGKLELPGLSLGDQDRFLTVAALLAAGQRNADARLASMSKKGDVEKYAYLAGAAAPDPKTKERYFKTYLDPKEPPEQWVQASLGYFHWPGQEKLCLPFLPEALKQVEWVKKHRKIFFMPAWIDSFINAHSSRVALQVAENFLELGDDLPIDIRRKLLQSIDGLRRAVKIRSKQ